MDEELQNREQEPAKEEPVLTREELAAREDGLHRFQRTWCREKGISLVDAPTSDSFDFERGIRLLRRALSLRDAEAAVKLGELVRKGLCDMGPESEREQTALRLFYDGLCFGSLRSAVLLKELCEERYLEAISRRNRRRRTDGPLVDHLGIPIRIHRTGRGMPVQAVLERIDGENVLTIRANVSFALCEDKPKVFYKAVKEGIMAWEGTYQVFGGQKVRLNMEITWENRLLGSVQVYAVDAETGRDAAKLASAIATKKRKAVVDSVFQGKRSFAYGGIKWSVRARKMIVLQSRDDRFLDDYEIYHTVKHEFGHVLGLGDLYESKVDDLPGVPHGTYAELDAYWIHDREYFLVMCDHHGVISNNDVEMILLAFRENRMQLFQPFRGKKKLSRALGRGN